MDGSRSNSTRALVVAGFAAFCTYFCMYAFRKPFSAATYDDAEFLGLGLKTVLVISQLVGYMLSKFIGIKVVSEMRGEYRAASIVFLILIAEAALVGFAIAPVSLKVVMLFFNGLPLGMIFGLVLAYLEGRKQTEALSAALCASFIVSSGVVKSVGQWLVQDCGVSEFQMPMMTGLIFFPPMLFSVWMLQRTPPPDQRDRELRSERKPVDRAKRREFFRAYWPGLSLMVFAYVALTVIRTIRDDFGVEIWRDMGVSETPSIYATTETVVAICVTLLNGLAVYFVHNLMAIRTTIGMMCTAFVLVVVSAVLKSAGWMTPFGFMVACGVGLYVPYVAFHTTVFERIIAASRHPSNLGFLMYVADAVGYLGYALVLVLRSTSFKPGSVLPFFQVSLIAVGVVSVVCLLAATMYFQTVLTRESESEQVEAAPSAE